MQATAKQTLRAATRPCRANARLRGLLPQLLPQLPYDAFFQPGDVALADADGIGHLLLGPLHAVQQAEAQLHDLPLPGRELLHRPAEAGPLGVERTQKEVADAIGISQSYISRLEKRIIRQLREQLGE